MHRARAQGAHIFFREMIPLTELVPKSEVTVLMTSHVNEQNNALNQHNKQMSNAKILNNQLGIFKQNQ